MFSTRRIGAIDNGWVDGWWEGGWFLSGYLNRRTGGCAGGWMRDKRSGCVCRSPRSSSRASVPACNCEVGCGREPLNAWNEPHASQMPTKQLGWFPVASETSSTVGESRETLSHYGEAPLLLPRYQHPVNWMIYKRRAAIPEIEGGIPARVKSRLHEWRTRRHAASGVISALRGPTAEHVPSNC